MIFVRTVANVKMDTNCSETIKFHSHIHTMESNVINVLVKLSLLKVSGDVMKTVILIYVYSVDLSFPYYKIKVRTYCGPSYDYRNSIDLVFK